MELKDFLNSINRTKENVIRGNDSPSAAEKLYPFFVVAKIMASHLDTILVVNELNIRGIQGALTNRQHYEYLLHEIPKGNRFSQWIKPEKEDPKVQLLMKLNNYSYERALEVVGLIPEEEWEKLMKKPQTGG